MPTACAAIPMRPPSSVAIATAEPAALLVQQAVARRRGRPRAARSEVVRRVEAELLLLARDAHVVGVEDERTRRRARPPSPGRCARRARTCRRAMPFVIHCFAPFSTQPSPSGRALVRSEPASEPASGSVSANAPSSSPRASGGTKRSRCSSVPNARIGSVAALVCTATVTPTPASARESSSSTRTYERKSAPAPPYSSGTHTPISPSSASFGEQLVGEAMLAIPVGRVRGDLGLGELARRASGSRAGRRSARSPSRRV